MEQQDEWEVTRRHFPREWVRKMPGDPVRVPEPMALGTGKP